MVGRVGYAPTTPAMSMQYSIIELKALVNWLGFKLFFHILYFYFSDFF